MNMQEFKQQIYDLGKKVKYQLLITLLLPIISLLLGVKIGGTIGPVVLIIGFVVAFIFFIMCIMNYMKRKTLIKAMSEMKSDEEVKSFIHKREVNMSERKKQIWKIILYIIGGIAIIGLAIAKGLV